MMKNFRELIAGYPLQSTAIEPQHIRSMSYYPDGTHVQKEGIAEGVSSDESDFKRRQSDLYGIF